MPTTTDKTTDPGAGGDARPQSSGSEFAIVEIAGGVAAVEWGLVRFADLPAFHRSARGRVNAAIAERGVTPTGPGVTFTGPPEGGALAIAPGVMVAEAFDPVGAVTAQVIPAGRAAHFRLEGPYEKLGESWIALNAWKAAQGLKSTGLGWEVYSDPQRPITDLYSMIE